jgi:hypothetical protein
MRRPLILCIVLIFSVLALHAQDRIQRKGGEIIRGKVTEIGLDEVKYKLAEDPDGPVYAISKDLVVKIIYANGRVETYSSQINDKEAYIGQPRNALKLNFLSPLSGYTGLNWEHHIKPGRSFEASLAIIGLGRSQQLDGVYAGNGVYLDTYRRGQAGVGLGFGYKFVRTPDFINHSVRYAHLFQGAYLKPTIYLGSYGENIIDGKTGTAVLDRRNVTYGALMLELGKQWVFGQKFVFEFYGGLGYAVDNIREDANVLSSVNSSYLAQNFNFFRLGQSPGFAVNTGIRFGILLGSRKH